MPKASKQPPDTARSEPEPSKAGVLSGAELG